MAKYLVTFTPLEPYFFGGERVFAYGKDNSSVYFIKSEEMPSQSTIFGTLRYCCIEKPTSDFQFDPAVIGKESFRIGSEKKQDFGCIRGMSPLFMKQRESYYIKTPFDHNGHDKAEIYQPFHQYKKINTGEGEKYFPLDFDSKTGVPDSFVDIETGRIKRLIHTTERIGINTNVQENGFFKKQFAYLEDGCAFAVAAEIENLKLDGRERLVYMGQGKTAFSVQFALKECDFAMKAKLFLQKPVRQKVEVNGTFAVALGDLFLNDSAERLNGLCFFVNNQLKNYRGFFTKYGEKSFGRRFGKEECLQHFIKAGSVFFIRPQCREEFQKLFKNENCEQIGLNHIEYLDK